MKRLRILGIICVWLGALLLGNNAHAQGDANGIGTPFAPHMKMEAVLTAARAALLREKFSPAAFEMHDATHYDKLPVDWEQVSKNAKTKELKELNKGSLQLLELRKVFGEGPVWVVNYWRTARVSHSGNWWDDANFGLSVLVYGEKKIAIIDGRTVEDAGDKTQ